MLTKAKQMVTMILLVAAHRASMKWSGIGQYY